MPKRRLWLLLIVPAVLLVFAAGWFLVVSPQRAAADAVRTQTEDVQRNVAMTQARLAELKRKAADLPAQQDALLRLEQKIPDGPQLPVLQRALASGARTAGVTLVTTAPGAPTVFVAPQTAPGATLQPSTAATQKPTGAAAATTTPVDTVYTVPLSVVVTGEYAPVQRFVALLEHLQRALLVQGFSLEHVKDAGGADTVSPGSLRLSIKGQVFVSAAEAATLSTPSAGTAGQVSPGPAPAGTAK
jgi:Tfp pilus assembly protein PilO